MTERLILRLASYADAVELERMFHDPRVNRYLPFERRSESGRTFVANARRANQRGLAFRFVARERSTNEFVGSIGLFAVDRRARSAELGYALMRGKWGQGFAHEATAGLLGWGFGALRLHRVEAVVVEANTASRRVLERHGFELEGRTREARRGARGYLDVMIYGLLEGEYRSSRGSTRTVRTASTGAGTGNGSAELAKRLRTR
jgi:[ribosomal protein S5]-alanine N-acetyltransferase